MSQPEITKRLSGTIAPPIRGLKRLMALFAPHCFPSTLVIVIVFKIPAMQLARAAWEASLSLLYPETCQLCEEARASRAESFVCSDCRGKVQWLEWPYCNRCGMPFQGNISSEFECQNCREVELHFCHARSAVIARQKALKAIHRYKYERLLCLEPYLAGLLKERAIPELSGQGWTCLVPVPLYPAKKRERGFNQAERLARRLAKELGLPLKSDLVRRVIPTKSQTRLSRAERSENMNKAFDKGSMTPDSGERVILVDDVLTTGSTTNACAKVLKQAGAAEVCVWTVARGL
jgi:ComF family protein